MSVVQEWTWGGSEGNEELNIRAKPDDRHQCESVEDPEVNSTGESQQMARDIFVGAWNSKYDAELTESDFTFVPRG